MATTENAFTTVPPAKAETATAVPARVVPVEAPAAPTAKVASRALVKKPAKRTAPVTKTGAKKANTTPAKKPATPVAKPVAKAPLKTEAAKSAKEKKAKLVRDSFTIPKGEYGVLGELKHRAGKLAMPIKKSELLRAGIKALTAMSDSAFLAALKAVPTIKTGRPAKG